MRQLLQFRQSFERILTKELRGRLSRYPKLLQDRSLVELLNYTETLAIHGGKRLRPYLANFGYRTVKTRIPNSVMQACLALELFHTFALVHDDLMDRGNERHGIPTAHIHAANHLRAKKCPDPNNHVAESHAILLGDLLFGWSAELIAMPFSRIPNAHAEQARRHFFTMVDDVIVGQMLDVDLTTRSSATVKLIEKKMLLKTASYSFIQPLQIGAALAGASKTHLRFLQTVGTDLGIAFQIQDDLFDVLSSPTELKKSILSDIATHQHTFLTAFLLSHGSPAIQKAFRTVWGKNVRPTDQPHIIKLLTDAGAIQEATRLVQKHLVHAERTIQRSSLSKGQREELNELIQALRERTH